MYIETSKGGQVGANQEGTKGEELQGTVGTALWPVAHCGAQAGEGRN